MFNLDAPTSVPRFLEFINANGQAMSREWFYRQIKAGTLPHLKLGTKILVVPGEILQHMRRSSDK